VDSTAERREKTTNGKLGRALVFIALRKEARVSFFEISPYVLNGDLALLFAERVKNLDYFLVKGFLIY